MLSLVMASPANTDDEKILKPNYKTATKKSETKCKLGKYIFQLYLGDEGKPADEDRKDFGYPYFWIASGKKKAVSGLPPKEYNELLFLSPKGPSLCQNTAAFRQKDGSVAIFLRQNNRPFLDKLSIIYYHPAQHKVIAFQRNIGISNHVEKIPEGFAYKIFDGPTDVVSMNVTVQGQPTQTSEKIFEYWNVVTRSGNKIITRTDRKVTWAKSPYQAYFKSQDDFEKAFGWDEKTQSYLNQWVYQVKEPNCIHPSKDRIATCTVERWHCDKKTAAASL